MKNLKFKILSASSGLKNIKILKSSNVKAQSPKPKEKEAQMTKLKYQNYKFEIWILYFGILYLAFGFRNLKFT